MNRPSILYLVFFLSLAVVIASTYIMTHSHLDHKHEADKISEIGKVKKIQTTAARIFQSKLEAKTYQLAISQINALLNDIKYELFKQSASPKYLKKNKVDRLAGLIKAIKTVENKQILNDYRSYKSTLNSLLKQVAVFPDNIKPVRNNLLKQIASLKYFNRKIRKLLSAAITHPNLGSLTREHTVIIGVMLVQIKKIDIELNSLKYQANSLNFRKRTIYNLSRNIERLKYQNNSLLQGNSKKKISVLKTSKVKALLLAVKNNLTDLQNTSQGTALAYDSLASKPDELFKLLSSIDKQKIIN